MSIDLIKQSIYNSISDELWRIFTYYALHGDSSSPEFLRPASMIKLCKDTQLVSSHLKPAQIELEIKSLARANGYRDSLHNSSFLISYQDFLQLIQLLSAKVYPKISPDLASKRVLLENILLFAHRRVPLSLQLDIPIGSSTTSTPTLDSFDPETIKILKETFNRSLLQIFNHYLNLAQSRRSHYVASEKIKDHNSAVQYREKIKLMKNTISYKEYTQFCYDFNLKSTTLLSAVQVGSIFLEVLPTGDPLDVERGINFDSFLLSIIYMARLAYPSTRVLLHNKVKGILLYMWKSINDSDKTMRLINTSRGHTLSSYAGSLNVFGSGMFSDHFLSYWSYQEFVDYSTIGENDIEDTRSGNKILKKISKENGLDNFVKENDLINYNEDNINMLSTDFRDDESSIGGSVNLGQFLDTMQSNLGISTNSNDGKRSNSIYITSFNNHSAQPGAVPIRGGTTINGAEPAWKTHGRLEIDGKMLTKLFMKRPEILDFLTIELQK